MNFSIELKEVQSKIEQFELNNLNVSIPKGVIVGVLGLNGAGKTTLFNTLMGNHLMKKGEINILGHSLKDDEMYIRNHMMMVQDVNRMNPFSKAKFIMKQFSFYYENFDQALFHALQKKFKFPLHLRLSQMSLGMIKKFKLALALASRPEILLLDEPLIGIDPLDKQMMIEHIQNFMEDESHTVLFSSHYVDDIEKIADYVMIIDQGQIKLFEEKDKLLTNYVLVDQRNITDLNALAEIKLMKKEEADFKKLTYHHVSLESIFIHLVKHEVSK